MKSYELLALRTDRPNYDESTLLGTGTIKD